MRYEAAGAVYHVMARGDGGKTVFGDDKDGFAWVDLLERACSRFGWRVHAWVLMGNHFHLLVETPEANLVNGMKWMLGAFSQAAMGLPGDTANLTGRGKWKLEKELVAALVRKRTGIANAWVAARLGMGHEVSVTRAVRRTREDNAARAKLNELEAKLGI